MLADVRRDLWVEPGRGSRMRRRRQVDLRFGPFAARLLEERRGELSETTIRSLAWGSRISLPISPNGNYGKSTLRG